MIQLRDYQIDLVNQVRDRMRSGQRRVMLYAPTGAGKTEVAMSIIRANQEKGKRAWFLCNRLELIDQASRRFDSAGIDHGVIQADHPRTDPRKPVQVCSIQTLIRRRLPPTDLIVLDEAHAAAAVSYLKILHTYNALPVIGLSATPFTKGLGKHHDELDGPLFESLVHTVSVRDLIQQGYLVDVKIYAPDKPDLSKVKIVAGDYEPEQLGEAVDKPTLVGNIVRHWQRLAQGQKTLAFATNIAHSQHIVQEFQQAGIRAEHIDCYTPTDQRRAILNRLRSGETRVVSNVAILAEGFDLPDLYCMILARPTKSLTRYLQQVGRILRPAPGKTHALLLDHSGSVEELGFPSDDLPLTLDDGSRKTSTAKTEKRKPAVCPSCAWVKAPGTHACPQCGFAPAKQNAIVTRDGKLIEMQRSELSWDQRQQFFSELVYLERSRHESEGWAGKMFHKKTGTWPRDVEIIPKPASQATRNWVLSRDIARQHIQARWKPSCPPSTILCPACGSDATQTGPGKGPHYASATCRCCYRMWWLPHPEKSQERRRA